MDSTLIELLRQGLSSSPRPIIGIVYDHLAMLKELPNQLLASVLDLLPQRDGLFALVTCFHFIMSCSEQ